MRVQFNSSFQHCIVQNTCSHNHQHYVKSVQIRSFFWSVFSRIHTEYGEILRIQSECGKIRTRKSSVFGHFSRSFVVEKTNCRKRSCFSEIFLLLFTTSMLKLIVFYITWLTFLQLSRRNFRPASFLVRY